MSLRQKTLLLISLTLIGLIGVLSASLSRILLSSFARLERQDTRRNVQRAREALDKDIEELSRVAQDWSAWDDTYNYVQDSNENFARKNLVESTFTSLKINYLLLLNNQGKQIFGEGFNLRRERTIPVPESLAEEFHTDSTLLQHSDVESRVQGLL
ncbi:MAG: histidine kinase, partial [Okeania sp. SIO2D1]|nr:histidine kinase [Okeania sp. SIO2D1]